MSYDHDAIRKAYPDAFLVIDDDAGIFDEEGNTFTVEQSKVDEARVELNKLSYRSRRGVNYPEIGDQLDDLYHRGAFSDEMAAKIKETKDAYPKPS